MEDRGTITKVPTPVIWSTEARELLDIMEATSIVGLRDRDLAAVTVFTDLFDARTKIADWRKEYTKSVPHSSLDYRIPDEFADELRKTSYGKNAGFACLKNVAGISHFATAPATG